MDRIITAALLLSLTAALAPGCQASGPAAHGAGQPRTTVTTLSGVCSLLLFLRVRRPRDPK